MVCVAGANRVRVLAELLGAAASVVSVLVVDKSSCMPFLQGRPGLISDGVIVDGSFLRIVLVNKVLRNVPVLEAFVSTSLNLVLVGLNVHEDTSIVV